MERYICIHGHFYQPPRENPWLENIELQDSAYPFHDWNERITAECYAPNGAARILDGDGRIIQIVNNYARMSYNIGPTLLSWMQFAMPNAYENILAADTESRELFSGHGSAMAQAYNHIILPLANKRDKETQVIWGIRDFEYRFQRKPEGMWLAETAANTETLEVLAAHGITFTVLSPYQAQQIRPKGNKEWQDVTGARVDPTRPYVQKLPSGRRIALFFYDAPISQGVAFEGLLRQGENLANRLLGAFSDERDWPQLVHIGTDGETYGHHHRYGDMALSYALRHIDAHDGVHLTNYGEYLAKHAPTCEAQIIEDAAWSCSHGVERWRSNCGCNSGGHPGWNQEWRAPLRQALDWLRDELVPWYEKKGGELLRDPWAARNAYIAVILDRSQEHVEQFFAQQAKRSLSEDEQITVLKLMELQRHAMLMYTSCGWFFDELSGIETVQVIQYAGRVIQLAEDVFDTKVEQPFLERLQRAKSNIPEYGDGANIYQRFVKPAIIDLERVCAHYAVSSLFESYSEQTGIYHYRVDREDYHYLESGRTRLAVGKARITSEITWESRLITYGVMHFGDHNMNGGVRNFVDQQAYEAFVQEAIDAFRVADLAEVIRILDRHFEELTYSLKTLFRDEQRKILNQLLDSSIHDSEAAYRQIYNQNATLIYFLSDLGIPLPRGFHTAIEFTLNADLRRALEVDTLDLERIKWVIDEANRPRVEFDTAGLAHVLEHTLESMFVSLLADPEDQALLEKLEGLSALLGVLPFNADLWRVQNIYYKMHQDTYLKFQTQAQQGDTDAQIWTQRFISLGEHLGVRVTHESE